VTPSNGRSLQDSISSESREDFRPFTRAAETPGAFWLPENQLVGIELQFSGDHSLQKAAVAGEHVGVREQCGRRKPEDFLHFSRIRRGRLIRGESHVPPAKPYAPGGHGPPQPPLGLDFQAQLFAEFATQCHGLVFPPFDPAAGEAKLAWSVDVPRTANDQQSLRPQRHRDHAVPDRVRSLKTALLTADDPARVMAILPAFFASCIETVQQAA